MSRNDGTGTSEWTRRGRRVAVNDVALQVIEAGPADGRLVVLLHGFPEFSYGWRRQIDPLAAAGFRVSPPIRGATISAASPKVSRPTISTPWSPT